MGRWMLGNAAFQSPQGRALAHDAMNVRFVSRA